jgi:hypothetical protein
MPWPDDDTLGAFGSASQVPSNQWFDVNTQTGQWGSPTPTIGQVAGGLEPPMTTPRSIQRVQRQGEMGGLTPQPGVWESIARGVGMASPMGRQYLQYADQSQQQALQNQLVARRQMLQDEQNERAEIRDDFTTLVKVSEIKSKSLRKLYTDRLVADMQARGKTLPPDFVEAFKHSGQEEAKAMLQFYEPLLKDLGLDPVAFAELVAEGGITNVAGALELAQQLKKQREGEAEGVAIAQQRQQLFGTGTLGDASGVTPPATPTAPGAPTSAPASTTPRQPVAAPSTEISTAIDEASRLYPQVRKELITSIAASESHFDSKAQSSAGAGGLMQLMPATARQMGVDDPFDVQQNVRGGTRYFAQMLTKYKGNEALALAAYNWGPGNVDKVEGDLSKMPEETQAYVKTTLQRASGGGGTAPDMRMQVAGPAAPAPTGGSRQAQAQLTRLDKQIEGMTQYINANLGSGKERTKGFVNELQQERTRLLQERDKLLETPRAVERQRQEQPLKLEQQRAGAEVALEAKANEPIGTDNALKMNLPPSTKWKDVPKDVRVLDNPSPGERQKFSDYKASHEGMGRVLTMLDQPGAQKIVGTLFSEPEASFNRRVGEWLSTVTPEQRKFVASLAAEISEIRHQLSGAAVSPQEFAALKPMFPDPGDPDVATVRAKLEALREWLVRKHDAYRDQLDQVNIRTPKALERSASPPPIDPKAQQALDILKPKGK